MTIPTEYGGQGRPLIDAILAIETAAKYCGVTARVIVETNMGALGCIMAYGTEEQRRLVAHRILKEGDKPAIAMTEPEAGTALTDLTTRADKQGDKYVINGIKHWITGGGVSVTNLVFARFYDAGKELGIGGILVDKGTPGFTFGRIERAMGLRGIPETELLFTDCEVPMENVVVPGDGSAGFKNLMYGYNGQRVGAAAVALGIAQGAHDLAVDYMKKRRAFDRPISEFQGLQWMIAESKIKLNAARLLMKLRWPSTTPATHPLKSSAKASRCLVPPAIRRICHWNGCCAMCACSKSAVAPPRRSSTWSRARFLKRSSINANN
jgi:alkylation response protein AidB-like acyl-CoA dehydrogenase